MRWKLRLEEVFKVSGVPTHTFVPPDRYDEIKVSLRTPGRCMVVEGPSGIGKTTIITKLLDELKFPNKPVVLSGRNPADIELIEELPSINDFGVVVVDDFHRLPDSVKRKLSDFMKYIADIGDESRKLVLIGINKAGDQLIKYGSDLGLRMDVFKLEANSPKKIMKLIEHGEEALNVVIRKKDLIAERSRGSFQIAQLLCFKVCAREGMLEKSPVKFAIKTPVESVIEDVMVELGRQYKEATLSFARGTKIRREGKAPYLHILKWLSLSDEGSLDLREEMNKNPTLKGSVGQVVNKGFLSGLLKDNEKKYLFEEIVFYDRDTHVFGAEDPKFLFYIRNIVWRVFAKECGFSGDFFGTKYDFALSFAGADRPLVEIFVKQLRDREISVFYDFDQQHEILGANVEEYLAPIYRSEARYVIPFLSSRYPTRIWTKFESEQFKDRFGDGSVIPIRFTDVAAGFFSDESKYGGLTLNPSGNLKIQAAQIVAVLAKRIIADREQAAVELS